MTLELTDTSSGNSAWQAAAKRAPVDAREQFHAWRREMLAGGVPLAVANVLGSGLYLEPDEPEALELVQPAPPDPLPLTDQEWHVLAPRFAIPKTGPTPDYRAMIDNYLRRVLRKKNWKDCGGGRVRMQVRALARNGTWSNVASTLDRLPLSPARRADLARVCKAAMLGASRKKAQA